MTSKCANPECCRPFFYFRGGRLFAIEVQEGRPEHGEAIAADSWSQKHKTEFFWLCADCCCRLTLRAQHIDGTVKAVLVPLLPSTAQRFRADDKEELYEAA